jgi:hypothetical protein
MQCLGLTSDRRRCGLQAVGTVLFCGEHQDQTIRSAHVGLESRGGFRAFLIGQLRKSTRRRVPDDARFGVPVWLKTSPTTKVVEHLLHHPDATVRWSAAFVLRKRRDPSAIEPLWRVLHFEPSSLVRQQAAVALGKIGTAVVLGPLTEGLVHDSDASVRQACAIALGNLGFRSAAIDLMIVLQHEEATFVRWDCVLSLGQVGDRGHEPLLRGLADKEPAEVVRRAYREVLGRMQLRE